jgi:hypothetical protein
MRDVWKWNLGKSKTEEMNYKVKTKTRLDMMRYDFGLNGFCLQLVPVNIVSFDRHLT